MNADIYQSDAEVIANEKFAGEQCILKLKVPEIASTARPGSFVHIQCDPERKLRRPISIMRVDSTFGTVDLLFKIVGEGTRLLAAKPVGAILSLLGPIGKPFKINESCSRPLLIGGGVGMPPMVFLAEALKSMPEYKPLVILGSEVPFPFAVTPSTILIDGMPDGVIGTMPLLDGWGVACRLASLNDYPGVFQGYVTDLAREWLATLGADYLAKVEIFSCGPETMLEAVHKLALEFDLPCQVSLEEYMACGVGGCAGCAVEIKGSQDAAMLRVCVDGPVFASRAVFGC